MVEDEWSYGIVSDVMCGNLQNLTEELGLPLSEEKVHEIMIPIFQAVFNLHRMNIVHRKIRPENLLLTSDRKSLKLSGFGMANFYTSSSHLSASIQVDRPPAFLAPEELGMDQPDEKSDFWSLGCILF